MSTLCCSNVCKKQTECARHSMNNEGMHYVEDFYSFGSGTLTNDGCKIECWCGELGNYKMFKPIEEEPEETIPFPFQFLNKCFLGEMNINDALDYTIDEVNRLIEEYVEKHSLKT